MFKFLKLLFSLILVSGNVYADSGFNIENYKLTYMATRDAYNKAHLENAFAASAYAQVIKLTVGSVVADNEKLSRFGEATNVCEGLFESKKMRDSHTVLSELSDLLKDERILKTQTDQRSWDLKLFQNDVGSYFEQFDQTVFNNITDINTQTPLHEVAESIYKRQFDAEDYATTYRATRDAYLKASNELVLSTGPYDAAKTALAEATRAYYNFEGCADAGYDPSIEDVLADSELQL